MRGGSRVDASRKRFLSLVIRAFVVGVGSAEQVAERRTAQMQIQKNGIPVTAPVAIYPIPVLDSGTVTPRYRSYNAVLRVAKCFSSFIITPSLAGKPRPNSLVHGYTRSVRCYRHAASMDSSNSYRTPRIPLAVGPSQCASD